MSLSVNPIRNYPSFRGHQEVSTSQEKVSQKHNVPTSTLITGLAALALAGTTIYYATKGKANKSAENVTKPVEEAVTKQLEKLPSRSEVLESLGLKLNDVKRLAKENGELYTGTHSYTARKGVNIEEQIFNGQVASRKMITQETMDNPKIKYYEYYTADNSVGAEPSLRNIRTVQNETKPNTISNVMLNQKALQDYSESLKFKPKTDAEIEALKNQGIDYQITKETCELGDFGKVDYDVEIYTYPENSPIKTKKVFYGERGWTHNGQPVREAKEISLTFREPQVIENSEFNKQSSQYVANTFTLVARNYGFSSDMPSGTHRVNIDDKVFGLSSCIPFSNPNQKPIIEAIEQEFPKEALNKIRYGK